MATVLDIIKRAFLDINHISVGVTPSATQQADGLARLNDLLSQFSDEGLMAFNQVGQSFTLTIGQPSYTLGNGGTMATTSNRRAQKVTAWRATYNNVISGGPVLSLPEFGAGMAVEQEKLAAINTQGVLSGQIASFPSSITRPVPSLVGADTAYPLINVRLFPTPSTTGPLELFYWTPITAFAAVSDVIAMPDGWELMLRTHLALDLYPQYPREGLNIEVLAANAQKSKAAIMSQNNMLPSAPEKQ